LIENDGVKVEINLFYVTLILIISKLLGLLSWSWWIVFLPVLIPLMIYLGLIITIVGLFLIEKIFSDTG